MNYFCVYDLIIFVIMTWNLGLFWNVIFIWFCFFKDFHLFAFIFWPLIWFDLLKNFCFILFCFYFVLFYFLNFLGLIIYYSLQFFLSRFIFSFYLLFYFLFSSFCYFPSFFVLLFIIVHFYMAVCGNIPLTLRALVLHCKHEELQSKYT